jgi:hypothetical protein
MERWHFYREPDYRGGYSWRWERQCSDVTEASRTIFYTFWGCVQNAVQAGFDPSAVDAPPLRDSIVVELRKKADDS